MHEHRRKTAAAVLLTLTLLAGATGLFAPRAARAQLAVTDPVTGANTTIRNYDDFLDKVLLGGVTMAFINSMNYFSQKIAYDAAVYISSGGKGEGPLFQNKDFGSYLGDVALGAAGEAIGTFSQIGFLGFNLCEPSGPEGPRINLALELGIAAQYQPPTPRCEWSRISQSWDQFTTSFATGEVLRNIQLSVGPGQTGLHAFFQAPIKVSEKFALDQSNAEKERTEGQGFKSLTDVVTGRQKTPAAVVRETALEETARQPGQAKQATASVIGPVLSKGVVQVLSVALGTFVNTLSSELLKRAFTDGSFNETGFDLACSFRDAVPGSRDALSGLNCPPDVSNAEGAARGGRAAAQASFSGLLAPRVQEVNAYDAIAEFTVCPDTFRGPTNCAMDPGFAAGVRVALQGEPLTVRDAIRQGYLHADWPLVSPTGDGASRNADPFCFNNGYCYSNLVKLRKARIIPIGFELAAETASADTTLGKVVAAFNDCTGPNGKFCKLIDPDWVLKYPLTQCRAKVFGPTLLAADSDIRSEICVDAPTCISENPDGTCGAGYGYCTREQNVWRVQGDSCPAQYASCQTYQGANGKSLSALTNTVDKSICSAENAGCNWYATQQNPAGTTGDWIKDAGRLFLDRDAGTCTASAAGCSELVRRDGALVNLVRNPSFESHQQTADRPDDWVNTPAGYETAIAAADGSAAVNPAGGISQRIGVDAGTTYAVSYSARRATGAATGAVELGIIVTDADGARLPVEDTDTTCPRDSGSASARLLEVAPASATEFVRVQCTITVPFGGERMDLTLRSGSGALADAVQVEYGTTATAFRSGAYADASRTYLKQPPAWLGCTGENSDAAECANFAGVCRPDEVGCDAYTPSGGGLAIPGIVSPENRCSAECVGYAAYKEQATTLSFAQYPVNMIPSRGNTCSAAAAGCTEFTNLDAAAAGGEAREYYAALRVCEKPAAGAVVPVYYTWEGSDTAGFQLKEWHLKAGVGGPAVISGTEAGSCTRDLYLAGGNPDCREFFDVAGAISYRLYSKTIVITPECRPLRMTRLPIDAAATAAPACNLVGGRFVGGSCNVCKGIGGTWNDPASTTDLGCTFNAFAPESKSCAAAEADCRLYTGNAGANVRQVGFWDFEGGDRAGWDGTDTAVSTESTAVGGHSIRVPAATTLSHAITADPRIVQGNTYYLTFWAKGRGALTARFSGATAGREFTTGGVTLGATWNRYELGPVLVDWTPGAAEALTLSGFGDTSFVDRIELTTVASNIAVVKDSWTIPAVCDQNAAGAFLPQAQLGCTAYRAQRAGTVNYLTGFSSLCREKSIGCTAFVATQQSPSPGRESWNALCVLPAVASAASPCSVDGREVCTVGVNRRSCRYQADDVPAPVTFTLPAAGLCQVDGITLVDGRGVPVTLGGAGTCSGQPQDLVVVPADRSTYLVDDPAKQCDQAFAGCTLTGRADGRVCTLATACTPAAGSTTCDCNVGGATPEFVCAVNAGETSCRGPLPFREPYPSGTTVSYAETPVLNDPKKYDQSLCTVEAVSCQEWTEVGPTTGKAYFKDPETRTCEYRENVAGEGGRSFAGWFRTGTDTACDRSLLVSGETFGIWKNGDVQYRGFVGQCPASASTCTEFLDPNDRDTRHPEGRPYDVLKNQKLDTATCRGQVNQLDGCVLFNDTSDPNLTANATVTNAASAARGNAAVPPSSCPGTGCSQCLYEKRVGAGATPDSITYRASGTLCASDSDCTSGVVDGETSSYCISGTGDHQCDPGRPVCSSVFFVSPPGGRTTIRYIDEFGTELPNQSVLLNTMRTNGNDANVVLKVNRDRQCGEWLACQSSTPVWDPSRNRFVEICDSIGRCNEFQKNGDTAQCVSWVNREPQILTENIYKERDVSASGEDYSGYSIPHLFDVEALRQIPVGASSTFRLARVIGTCASGAAEGSTCNNAAFPARGQGRCWQGTCAQAPNGSPIETDAILRDEPQPLVAFGGSQNAESPACRAYPERNSPFPNSVVKTWDPAETTGAQRALPQSTQPGFNRAATCEKGQDCECTYQKIEYQGGQTTVYLNADEPTAFAGICVGGPKEKQPCSPASDDPIQCGAGGTCQKISRKNVVQGLGGYCLERDQGFSINGLQSSSFEQPGRACVTWLPVDRLSGAIDVYNNYGNAGFNIASAAYCAVPEAYKQVRVFGHGVGAPSNDINVRYADTPESFRITTSCGEQDGDSRENYLVDDAGHDQVIDSGDGLEDDDFDESIPDVDCPGDTGFVVISGVLKGSDGNFRCSAGGDDDFQYFCVPKNSRHMADPAKSLCTGPQSSLIHAHRENSNNGLGSGGYNAQFYVVTNHFIQDNASVIRPPSWHQVDLGGSTGELQSGSAVAYYADCVATDTPIPGGPKSPEGSATPYFGCKDAVEVSTTGRTIQNKAFTGRIGNGRVEPPGSSALGDAPGAAAAELRYAWGQDPATIAPYGRAAVETNIGALTADTRVFSPLSIKTCVSGAGDVLPAADNTCASPVPNIDSETRPYSLVTIGAGSGANCDAANHCRTYGADSVAGSQLPNLANVTARLKQIFAATFNLFAYRPTNANADPSVRDATYVASTSTAPDPLVYDISDTVGHPPIVRAVGSCNTQNQCLEGAEGQISVNGVEDGNVTGGNGFKQATLRFFGYAQNDQMPIRNVIVDWGDGTNMSGNNPDSAYKNHRGYEQRRGVDPVTGTDSLQLLSKCDESTFSTSADACDSAAPFSFSHAYSCNSDGSARCADRSNNCVRVIDGRDACVYKPKVQITDNWGFCNGTCGDAASVAGTSCYDSTTNDRLNAELAPNECEMTTFNLRRNSPFTLFAGQIVVFPRD